VAKFMMIQLQSAPYAGTAYLNGAVTSRGHSFVLCLENNIKKILNRIREEKPAVIGFSCMTCFCSELLSIAREIKKRFDVLVIMGGPHPTLAPDVIYDDGIDAICRGEGEFALVELLDAIDRDEPFTGIANLWLKKDGVVFKNDLRPLAEPLDNIPLIDWSCYRGTVVQRSAPIAFLIRGCPYDCSYCFNEATRDLFKGRGSYVRWFSVGRSIQEIQRALDFFDPSPVLFTSDTFGVNIPWMEELFARYQQITPLPFVLLLRPELAKKEVIDVIKKYRCHSVAIGVESGSERVRREALNRHYSNELLLEVARNLHAAGIPFRTFSMMGLPTETEDELWETIDMNIRMQADFPRAAIFMPIPGAKLTQMAIDSGYLDPAFSYDDIPKSVFVSSVLKKINKDRLKNTLYFFQTIVIFPKSRKILKWLIQRTKPNVLYLVWFFAVFVFINNRSEGRRWISYLPYLFSNFRYR